MSGFSNESTSFQLLEVSPMGPRLDVHVVTEDDITVVIVKGDIDIATSEAFREQVLPVVSAAPVRAVLDLSNVGFCDSTGIGAIVEMRRASRERDQDLHVVPSRRVRAALRLAGLDQTLVLHDAITTAVVADSGDTA